VLSIKPSEYEARADDETIFAEKTAVEAVTDDEAAFSTYCA